jgi:soluble lytic murein transglycosylase-like protein
MLMFFGRNFFSACILTALLLPSVVLPEQVPDPELRDLLRIAAGAADSFDDRFDAEVWLTDMSRRLERQVRDPDERMTILTRVHYEAGRAGLEPELVLAVIEVESNFDRYAVSVAGALGLMQVMPFWRGEIGRPGDNLIQLETNLRYGCTILKFYLDKENGDLRRALGRYNGSLGQRKYPNLVINKLSGKWFQG